jgi:hypothetical protein
LDAGQPQLFAFNGAKAAPLTGQVTLDRPYATYLFKTERVGPGAIDYEHSLEAILDFFVGALTWDGYSGRLLAVSGEVVDGQFDCDLRKPTQFWAVDPYTYEATLLHEEEATFNRFGVAVDPDRGTVWMRGTSCLEGELQFTIRTYDPAAGWTSTIEEEEPVPPDWFRWESGSGSGAPFAIEFADPT